MTPQPIWFAPFTSEQANQRARHTLSDHLGIEFTEVTDSSLSAAMEVASHIKQPMGALHGGASCVLAETVASTAANYCVDSSQFYCVGLDLNINHIKQVHSGKIVAITTPFHLGKTTQVWEIRLCHNLSLIGIARLTVAVLEKSPKRDPLSAPPIQ